MFVEIHQALYAPSLRLYPRKAGIAYTIADHHGLVLSCHVVPTAQYQVSSEGDGVYN